MSVQDHSGHHSVKAGFSLQSKVVIVLVGFLIIAGALLFTEHRAHVLGLLIWLPLLACPFMHMFMHRGHGHHGSKRQQQDNQGGPS